jgi:SAM-dependent methyltransferase
VDKDEILSIYDDWYAESYDERFHGGDVWNDNLGAYKIELVGELLPPGGRWLDTGCGTGKHLSAFPDVERAGLDLSPSMLVQARKNNPGVEFTNGSYLDEHPEWVEQWDLVSNLWLSYQFVDSIRDIHRTVANLASWVKPDGALLMHVADCEDVARGIDLPWEDPETPVFSDSLYITAVLWSWKEANGREHKDLVAPQLQRMVNIFAQFFEDIEVRRWPSTFPGSDRPKAVIGRKKRAVPLHPDEVDRTYPYRLTFPPPDHPREHGFGDEPAVEEAVEAPEAAEPVAETPAPVAEVAAEHHAPPAAPSAPDVTEVPTGQLLREVLRRSDPADGRVLLAATRGVTRRVRRITRRGSSHS